MVVATSSLEVGFDDPDVGATLHHKRPRSMSSFVQRKGRAGRRRGLRPWTVLVLSDYGADRWAFQHAEKFFEPEIDAISLPIFNPYVLRTQGALALVDFIGRRIKSGSPYRFLAGPTKERGSELRAEATRRLLQEFINLGPAWAVLQSELAKVFKPFAPGGGPSRTSLVSSIVWEHPRPLLLQAIPSLLREVETGWKKAFEDSDPVDRGSGRRPMPQYIPSATFADLDVSEVRIAFPDLEKDEEYLGVAHALFEACPGRVSKRYATSVRELGYWLNGSETLLNQSGAVRSVQALFPDSLLLDRVDDVEVYQPLVASLAPRPKKVLDTSSASWEWSARFRCEGRGRTLPALEGVPWSRTLGDLTAFLHRDGSAVEVLRFSGRCDYEIRQRREDPVVGTVELASAGEGASVRQAVGFRIRADGIRLRINTAAINEVLQLDPESIRRFRVPFFQYALERALVGRANRFMVEWLAQVSVAALVATSALNRCTLQSAQTRLAGQRAQAAKRVLEVMFGARDTSGEDADDDPKSA